MNDKIIFRCGCKYDNHPDLNKYGHCPVHTFCYSEEYYKAMVRYKPKSLYNEYSAMNETGRELSSEAFKAIEPIFTKYLNMGYSSRDISHIIMGTVGEIESTETLKSAMEIRKVQKALKDKPHN